MYALDPHLAADLGAGVNQNIGYLQENIGYLMRVLVAVVLLAISTTVGSVVGSLIRRLMRGLPRGRILAEVGRSGVIALGALAALEHLHLPANVGNAILYATLATVAGVVIVAVGGGGIRTVQVILERLLEKRTFDEGRIPGEFIVNAQRIPRQANPGRFRHDRATGRPEDGAGPGSN